jgi:hypothetical protein
MNWSTFFGTLVKDCKREKRSNSLKNIRAILHQVGALFEISRSSISRATNNKLLPGKLLKF